MVMSIYAEGSIARAEVMAFCYGVDTLAKKSVFHHSFANAKATSTDVKHIQGLTEVAEAILMHLPEEYRDHVALGKKLKDRNWNPPAQSGLSRRDLQDFHARATKLFYHVIPKLEESPYDKDHKMPKEVQHYLLKDLREARIKKRGGTIHATTVGSDPVTLAAEKAKRQALKNELARTLGHGIEGAKGVTGTKRLRDINKKYVGIEKLGSFSGSILKVMGIFVRILVGDQNYYLSRRKNAQVESEEASYQLANLMELHDLVPTSISKIISSRSIDVQEKKLFQSFIKGKKKPRAVVTMVSMDVQEAHKSHTGSFKLVDPHRDPNKYIEFKQIMEVWNKKDKFSESEKTLFQKFILFDYAIGNLDRHAENWFVTLDANGTITSIKAIDNANSFPIIAPKPGAMRKQYQWKDLAIAKEPFTPEAKKFMENRFGKAWIVFYVTTIKKNLPNFFHGDMEKLFRQRASRIREEAKKPLASPASLAARA